MNETRVVLLTRASRPSGAQMAWRLFQSGFKPMAIIVEKRSRMVGSSSLRRLGVPFLWKKVWETIRIRARFYRRWFFQDRFKDPAYLSIEEWALDHPSVRVYKVEDHNGPETQELLWRLEPDIGVLTNTRRITKEILGLPRHGFLNLHLSALPQYAGLDSIFWALYHGEKEIGVTVHFASEEIDRGDIAIQKKIPVYPFDNEESLYEKALWVGTNSMVQALRQLERGTLERKPQGQGGSYFSWPTPRERLSLSARSARLPPACRQAGNDKLRVLHIITRMTRGGAQENTRATVLELRKKGYEVTLMTGPSWGEEGEILSQALEEGLEVVILPELVREVRPWKDLVSLAKLSLWLAKNRYDIIHTHSSKAGFLGRLAARFQGIPVVVHTPHGHVFHSYFPPWKERLFLSLERWAANWADRLIAVTERGREEHLEAGEGTRRKWIVIPSGVNEERFQKPLSQNEKILNRFKITSNKKIIGFVGRLAPVKGAQYFIEALPQIFKTVPDTHSFVVGDGEEKSRLQKRVEELGLNGGVTFVGHQDEIPEWMSLFDVLIVPSLNEGMGRVIAEAGLLSKAVVGSRVGGIPDLIEDGKTGLLVEPRNSSEIARAVTRLLADPALRERLGKGLRAKVLQGFTEDQMVEEIHHLYQEVMKEKGLP